MKEGDCRYGHDRRHEPLSECRTGKPEPDDRERGQSQVGQPVNQDPRLGIGLIEEQEVAEPSQAKPGITGWVALEVGDCPVEEDSRPLGL